MKKVYHNDYYLINVSEIAETKSMSIINNNMNEKKS